MSDAAPPIAAGLLAGRRRLAVDLASSYALSVARVASMAIAVGLLYRHTSATWVAAFVLMRSMLGVINYLLAGLGPAMLRELSRPADAEPVRRADAPIDLPASRPADASVGQEAVVDAIPTDADPPSARVHGPLPLDYATPPELSAEAPATPASRRFNAFVLSLLTLLAMGTLAFVYAINFGRLHELAIVPLQWEWVTVGVFGYAMGLILRGTSEPAGAASQWRGRLWLDNGIVVLGEIAFVALIATGVTFRHRETFAMIGTAYLETGVFVFVGRWLLATIGRDSVKRSLRNDRRMRARLITAASAVSVGSFADFLYAPANILIINQFLDPKLLAGYGPALQVDAALLLSISAIAPVLLPRVAGAVARGDRAAIRRMYLISMAAGLAVLVAGAAVILSVRGPLLRLWLGEVPTTTLAILPLVLVHTVVGGTAGVGRAVLLGMGRFRAYTLSAVVGGVANVALALLFVLGFGWGLRGIVLATIVAVVARCAVWMPWYVLRSLGNAPRRDDRAVD